MQDQQIKMQLKAEESKVSVMKAKAGARIKKMEAASVSTPTKSLKT